MIEIICSHAGFFLMTQSFFENPHNTPITFDKERKGHNEQKKNEHSTK
jgi:hypothetical protein